APLPRARVEVVRAVGLQPLAQLVAEPLGLGAKVDLHGHAVPLLLGRCVGPAAHQVSIRAVAWPAKTSVPSWLTVLTASETDGTPSVSPTASTVVVVVRSSAGRTCELNRPPKASSHPSPTRSLS